MINQRDLNQLCTRHYREYAKEADKCPSIRTSVSQSVRLSVFPSVSPSVRRFIRPSVHPSVRLFVIRSTVHPSVRQFVRPSIRHSICHSVRPSIRQSIRPSIRPSIRQSVRPSVRPSWSFSAIEFFPMKSLPYPFPLSRLRSFLISPFRYTYFFACKMVTSFDYFL